eukprot:jgi/Bigna1/128280/aug1.6_g2988
MISGGMRSGKPEMISGGAKANKRVQEFGDVRIKDLWQWDRESSSSSPDQDEKSSIKSVKSTKSVKREFRVSQQGARNAKTYPDTSCHDMNKIIKQKGKGKLVMEIDEKGAKLSQERKENPLPPKPNCFSHSQWESLKEEMAADLRYGEWAYHCHSKMMWWSTSLHRIFNVKKKSNKEGLKLSDYAKLIHEDDRDLLQFLFDRAVHEGVAFTVTHRCSVPTGKDGAKKTLWCHCICKVRYSSSNRRRNNMTSMKSDRTSAAAALPSLPQIASGSSNITDCQQHSARNDDRNNGYHQKKRSSRSVEEGDSSSSCPSAGNSHSRLKIDSLKRGCAFTIPIIKQNRGKTSPGSFSDDSPLLDAESKENRYLVGLLQDVTSAINDSDATENLKSYINNQEVRLKARQPLVADEIENANPVCQLS